MKKIIVLFSLMTTSIFCKAEYIPIYLYGMIQGADLILHARIIEVLENEIELDIIEKIKGEYSHQKIIIEKFENWSCASRWRTYKVGQEELIFLYEDKKTENWKIIGAGNEGEITIENKKLYYPSPYFSSEYLLEEKQYTLKEGKLFAIEFDLKKAIQGIKDYLKNRKRIDKMFSDKSILNFFPENKFYHVIINERIFNGGMKFSIKELENREIGKKQ